MIGEIIVAESFKLGLAEAINFLKSKSKNFKNIHKINIEQAYLKASNVENVKTIWQVDKSVNLNEFYYPSNIIVEDRVIKADSLNVFPENGKVVIQGTAGQGKSILLRHLTGVALRKSNVVPLFVELRKITDQTDLPTLICQSLNELGIQVTENELEHVYASNKFTLLFDAFDEIPEHNLKDTLRYIETICTKHYHQQVIITSRPGAEIQKIPSFNVFNLEQIELSDFKPMLLRFFNNDEVTVHQILKSLHDNNNEIISLVTTPLLLTLLAITYKTYNKIPTQLHEFYENIFHVLVNRHDATKPGFRREYKSNLNERELEDLFCGFCFYSMIEGKTSLSRQEALKITKKSCEFLNITPSSEFSFLSDCIKNTCLLLEEGFNYHFIHKSIREYHSAKFISGAPNELKKRFYTMAKQSIYKYRVELDFLSVIDEHYFNKFFLLPTYESIFQDLSLTEKYTHIEPEFLLQDSYLYFNNELNRITSFRFNKRPILFVDYMNDTHNAMINLVIKLINNNEIKSNGQKEISIITAIYDCNLYDESQEIINKTIKEMHDKFVQMKISFNRKDALIENMFF
ncbi:NACHT domain-containing protein [Vibrio cholerae]|uniref:NACHT domain-containing protein n=1 Tax=Vibrio cholerae TaxID=666 RepID=UPI0011EFA4C5|nr:NACHT domain-containing protein [Vibrio cholerae]ELY5181616.1 NACHT domain-containing protein [Vibrio cholerae]TYW39943.1 NACHT domain-containing protein [Vibrio cholerae]TYW48302.1 NACHT domain-containing protein [Vibrio cholerae]HAS3583341.1 NACHT domain-containing protein [Vibrio cholerae]HDZ9290854.1 NACHT domain-containing protein [Vibrio cholerae]